ncbi:hypothetical protein [Mycolicibacterium lutetiense]
MTPSPTSTQTPPGPYEIPQAFDHHSFYWTAGPGIDLTGGAAVPVRAFFESWTLVWNQFQPEQAYPGYAKAAANIGGYNGSNVDGATPYTAVFGTTRFHLVTLNSTDRTIHGVVCQNEAATIHPVPGGTGYMQLVPGIGIIEFNFARYPSTTSPSTPQSKPQVLQQGLRQAPTGDVFNNFQLINARGGEPPNDPLYLEYESQCRAGLANPASVNLPGTDYKQDPQPSDPEFQPLPQTPGWPDSVP